MYTYYTRVPHVEGTYNPVKLSWIFPGAKLNFFGAPGNIQGNLTGKDRSPLLFKKF